MRAAMGLCAILLSSAAIAQAPLLLQHPSLSATQIAFDYGGEIWTVPRVGGRALRLVTGEGRLDAQTLDGKAPAGVATIAHKLGKRTFAIVGEARDQAKVSELFDGVYQLRSARLSEEETLTNARELLRERAREMAGKWKS